MGIEKVKLWSQLPRLTQCGETTAPGRPKIQFDRTSLKQFSTIQTLHPKLRLVIKLLDDQSIFQVHNNFASLQRNVTRVDRIFIQFLKPNKIDLISKRITRSFCTETYDVFANRSIDKFPFTPGQRNFSHSESSNISFPLFTMKSHSGVPALLILNNNKNSNNHKNTKFWGYVFFFEHVRTEQRIGIAVSALNCAAIWDDKRVRL